MLVLLTGGAANGKSRYAEELAAAYRGRRTYVATMRPDGEDGLERIRRHRRQREGLGFVTLERPRDIPGLALAKGGLFLLECLPTLLDNEWFPCGRSAGEAAAAVLAAVDHLAAAADVLIVVTNRIEAAGQTYDAATLAYIDTLSALGDRLIGRADAAVEMVAGRPVCLKGEARLRSVFPAARLGSAVLCRPGDVVSEADGLVLALADAADAVADLPHRGDGVLTDLDAFLETWGQTAFAYPFERLSLVFARFPGDGVIPLEAGARRRREQTGRLLIQIAAKASRFLYRRGGVWLLVTPGDDSTH